VRRPLQQYYPDYRFLFSIAVPIIFFDQLTKWLVRINLSFTDFWAPFDSLARVFRIVHWKNTGAAFGIFQDGNAIFLALGIVVTLTIINFYPVIPRDDRWLRAALAVQLAGAVGNLIDRIHQGYVTDFFSVMNFPVFNIADASISLGVVLILAPFLPQLVGEIDEARLMRESRQINQRYRNGSNTSQEAEEPMTLGLVEVLMAESETMRRFTISQDIRRIRRRVQVMRRGMSRG